MPKTYWWLEFVLIMLAGTVVLAIIGFIGGTLVGQAPHEFLFYTVSRKKFFLITMLSYVGAAVICYHKRG